MVSTVKDLSVFMPKPDLAFSQLFFPVKGILAVYDRVEGDFFALPGADDNRYVQSNPVWSPDGKNIVFIRAKAVLAARPNSAKGYFNIGNVYLLLGRTEPAAESIKEGLRLDPENGEGILALCQAMLNGGHFGEAARYYKRAMDNRSDAVGRQYNFDLAKVLVLEVNDRNGNRSSLAEYYKSNNILGSITERYRRRVAESTRNAALLNLLGNDLAKRGLLEEAVGLLKASSEIEPGNQRFRRDLMMHYPTPQ
ncbi:MAG: tetratricopeptide repeat protein [Deltaproteobacteria bacterium]|nr:tetratricopeptide repeat protein [Deltaproteobacteria bacterium]